MLVLGLAGIAVISMGSRTGSRQAIVAPDTTVAIRTFQFRPGALVVPVGTRVVWANADDIEHTITAGSPDSASGLFSGTLRSSGAHFARTFTQPGTYSYYCDRHHFMRGEVRVTPTGEN